MLQMAWTFDYASWFLLSSSIAAAALTLAIRKKNRAPHPPGPTGLPFIGNLQLPDGQAWKTYRQWGDMYGADVVRINVLGKNIVVLNNLEACTELLDKRAAIYSDRPSATTMIALCGWKEIMVMLRYGSFWRDTRRALQPLVHPQAIHRYRGSATSSARDFLRSLLSTPNGLHDHIKNTIGRQALVAIYGVAADENGEALIKTAEHALEGVTASMRPGRFIVDMIPILRYLPEWFPGAAFKGQARLWRESTEKMLTIPWMLCQELEATGNLSDNCAAKLLLQEDVSEQTDERYRNYVVQTTLASMYGGSIDTLVSTVQAFFLAMVLYPDVQKTARQHIEQVCKGRLPDFTDFDTLVYVHAIVKEVMRWHTVAPLGVVHVSTQDDVYNGYFIPRGTYVLPNAWAVMHDPHLYSDPKVFSPDRYVRTDRSGRLEINQDVRGPETAIFGFGRRACPGRHAAYETIWIIVASVLASFDVSKKRSTDDVLVNPRAEFTEGFISFPQPFICELIPLPKGLEGLLEESEVAH